MEFYSGSDLNKGSRGCPSFGININGLDVKQADDAAAYVVIPGTGEVHAYPVGNDPRETKAFPLIEDGRCLDPWEHVHGCNFSAHRSALIKINGFDEEYDGAWGAEDVDIAFRLISQGFKVKPVKSRGYHIDHTSRENKGQREKLIKKMSEDIIRSKPKSWK